MTISNEAVMQHVDARNEVGQENYCPLVESGPADAVTLFVVLGSTEHDKRLKEQGSNFAGEVTVRLAIFIPEEYSKEQVERRYNNYIASMRTNMSRMRKTAKERGNTLRKFKMIKGGTGWQRHSERKDVVILELLYKEDSLYNEVARDVSMRALSL